MSLVIRVVCGAERVVRMEWSDGSVLHYEGEKDAEREVREEGRGPRATAAMVGAAGRAAGGVEVEREVACWAGDGAAIVEGVERQAMALLIGNQSEGF